MSGQAARFANRRGGSSHGKYGEETDTLTVIFRDVPVAESDEENPGIVLDYDGSGNLVSIEVLDASTRVEDPRSVIVSTSARP